MRARTALAIMPATTETAAPRTTHNYLLPTDVMQHPWVYGTQDRTSGKRARVVVTTAGRGR